MTSYNNKPVYMQHQQSQEYRTDTTPTAAAGASAQPILIISGGGDNSVASSSASSSLSSSPKSMPSSASCSMLDAHQMNQNYYLLATLKHRLMTAAAAAAHIESTEAAKNRSATKIAPQQALDSSSSCGEESEPMDCGNGAGGATQTSTGSNAASSLAATRANRFFPDQVVDILNRWFVENADYPYPDEHMTNVLAKEANISAKQVRKWFANKRVRSNKCFKQTFKAKKDSISTTNRTRFHAKSVSEIESPSKVSSATSGVGTDNESDVVVASSLPSVSSIYGGVSSSFDHHNHPVLSTSSSSFISASSSPNHHRRSSPCGTSSHTSSPVVSSAISMHPQSHEPIHYHRSEATTTTTTAPSLNSASFAAAALYNPFLIMNFLQNQLKARLNDSDLSQSTFAPSQHFTDSPLIKRKTHLSNCFMQDMSKEESSSISNRSSSSDIDYDEMPSTSASPSSSSAFSSSSSSVSYLNDATNSSPTPDQLSSYNHTHFHYTQWQHQQQRIKQQQQQPVQCCNQENKQPTSLVRKTKINFGDISDLIN